MLAKQRFASILHGLASGAASVDPRGPGGTGRLLAAMGAGASGGMETAGANEIEALNRLHAQQADYAVRRAQAAGDQATVQTNIGNQNLTSGWQSQIDDQNTTAKNQATAFDVTEGNAQRTFDAGQANQKNLYDWTTQQWQREQPQIVKNAQGIAVIGPGGQIQQHPWDSNSSQTNWNKLDKAPLPIQQQQKYQHLAQLGDVPTIAQEVMRDVVSTGQGPQVFGELWQKVIADAEKGIPPAVQTDPKAYQAALNNAIVAQLTLATQGNYDWIPNAAAMGNPGARLLMSGGQ